MKGSTAFVTGGANGIGRATVKALLEAGVNVAVADYNRQSLEEAVAEMGGIGPEILPIPADLSDIGALDCLLQKAIGHFGKVDHLVNSAASMDATYDLMELDEAEWDRILTINLKMPVFLLQAFARHAIGRGGGGRIVLVSSAAGFRAVRNRASYGSAKGGLSALVRIAAAQLGPHDINVNAVAPGTTNTHGTTVARNVDVTKLHQAVQSGPSENLLKRLSEPEDVAGTIAFLCTPTSRQITGQTIHVSAGLITP